MNKRTALISCALAALAMSAVTVVASAQPHHEANESAKVRRAKENTYRSIEVRGAPDGVGVSSGLVVVYGHPLQQPYHFVHRDHRLFINGVQVEPTLIMQREDDKTRKELTQPEAGRLTQLRDMANSARRHYFDNVGKIPSDKLHDEVLKIVLSHPLIKEARWMNDVEIVYTRKDDAANDSFGNGISFSPRSARADAKPKKSPEQLVTDHIKELEDHLKSGGCLFYGTIGAWHGPSYLCKDIKKSVNQVMAQAALSSDEKETKLRGLFDGSHEVPLDIIANYRADEWK